MRKSHPNRIGANPVSVKASELAPARGRLSNRGSAFGPQPEPPGPLFPKAPGGGFEGAPGEIVREAPKGYGTQQTIPYSRHYYGGRPTSAGGSGVYYGKNRARRPTYS